MSGWSDGYVTSVEYTRHFYPFLAPSALNYAMVLAGVQPPEIDKPFTYCELGCGRGYSTALLAAANPTGRFWGVDFNPAHIAGASQLKAAAGIDNLTYIEKSFAELNGAGLPAFDYIVLHGVWSWINAGNRDAVIAFIYANLKPGGVVFISYNALPGWAPLAPVRQIFLESQRHKAEISPQSVDEALAMAEAMRTMEAGFFRLNPAGAASLEAIGKQDKSYLLHEYFNQDWQAFYFSDVARDLRAAKLAFACSSDIVEQVDKLSLPAAAEDFLKTVPDATARQTIRDYFRNARFRRDIFTRGARKLQAQERAALLGGTRLALMSGGLTFPQQINFPVGAVTMPAEPCTAMCRLLAERPRSLSELMANPALAGVDGQNAFQALLLLAASGRVQPAPPQAGDAARKASVERFNAAVLMQPAGLEAQMLASPVLGNGIATPRVDQLFLALKRAGSLTVEAVTKALSGRGVTLRQTAPDGGTEPAAAGQVSTALAEFESLRLPVYRAMGVSGD